jgi:small nuclear ribonucleoprotein (snRNP)-like protein
LVIQPEAFESLLKSNVEIALKMLKKMAGRLLALDQYFEYVLLEEKDK